LSTLNCYNKVCTTYAVTINQDGSWAATAPSTNTPIVGYESTATLGRICIPTAAVFSSAFSTVSATFSSALSQGDLANFITDLKNVIKYYKYRIGNGCWLLLVFAY
jgi:hypothetical protein